MENDNHSEINNSTFKKNFCKVTPLSRFVAAVFFIFAPLAGFFLGTQYKTADYSTSEMLIETYPVQEIVSEQAMDLPKMKEVSWYLYKNTAGFSVMIPESLKIIDGEESVLITSDRKPVPYAYTINYRPNLQDKAEAVKYANEIYGYDCEVTLDSENYLETKFNVVQPNLDMLPEERPESDCSAFKTEFMYNSYTKLALTWRLSDYIFPINTWPTLEEIKNNKFDDLYYDLAILDSIRFTY